MVGIINIEYNESKDNGYEYVYVTFKHVSITYKSGDVVKDYRNAVLFTNKCKRDYSLVGKVSEIMLSSSCDNFVFDIPNYKWIDEPLIGELIVKDE